MPHPLWQLQVQPAVFLDLRLNGLGAKVAFIDDEEGFQLLERSSRPVAIHQEPVGCRLAGRHDGKPVDVGGHRFGAAACIDSLDQIAARCD
jgi:hypothetical protein